MADVGGAAEGFDVSILTRPGGRVLLELSGHRPVARRKVSILTRPGGRGAAALLIPVFIAMMMFQSSPGPGAGCCCPAPRRSERGPSRFNPHPARGPGAAAPTSSPNSASSPFQSSPGPGAGCCSSVMALIMSPVSVFQSSPGPGAGCCACQRTREAASLCGCFNPHPARGPGAAEARWRGRTRSTGCFNPHPARVPGAATSSILLPGCRFTGFNPHPARGPGAARGRLVLIPNRERVSILTRPGGRVLLGIDVDHGLIPGGFQSSPGPGAGCCLPQMVSSP